MKCFAQWNHRSIPAELSKTQVIFPEGKQLASESRGRGRIICVALNEVCMTHAACGQRQSKQPSLSSYLPLAFQSHHFVTASSRPFVFARPPSEALSHVSRRQISGGAALWRGGCSPRRRLRVSALALRHKAQSGSDRPSCHSQGLCPCCQFVVLLWGKQRGRIKIGDNSGT